MTLFEYAEALIKADAERLGFPQTPSKASDAEIHKLAEIDLRGRNMDVRYEPHGMFRGKAQWSCWDNNSYDGPESAIGVGESKEDALVDLLDKIDEPLPKPRAGRVVHNSPFEPPTIVDDADVDFDSDLEESK